MDFLALKVRVQGSIWWRKRDADILTEGKSGGLETNKNNPGLHACCTAKDSRRAESEERL
jgi:hypothetical protein